MPRRRRTASLVLSERLVHDPRAGEDLLGVDDLQERAEEVGRAHRHQGLVLELLLGAPRDVSLQVQLLGELGVLLAVVLVNLPEELEDAVCVYLARRTVEDGVVSLWQNSELPI